MNFGLLDCRRGKTNACTKILLESLHLEDVWRPELFGNLFVSFISPATSDFYPQKHHPPKQTWSGVMRRHVIFRVDVRCWRGWRSGLPWGTNQVAAQMMSHNHPNMKLPKKNDLHTVPLTCWVLRLDFTDQFFFSKWKGGVYWVHAIFRASVLLLGTIGWFRQSLMVRPSSLSPARDLIEKFGQPVFGGYQLDLHEFFAPRVTLMQQSESCCGQVPCRESGRKTWG